MWRGFQSVSPRRSEDQRWQPRACGARSARRSTRSTRGTSASGASARSRSPTSTSRSATSPRRAAGSRAGPQNIWRYADFLPLEAPPGPSQRATSRAGLPAGCTPLIKADRLAERLGLGEVWIKNDAANPTHSFKDRVVSVAVARARELGYDVIACASTGNLANSRRRPRRRARPGVLRLHPVRPRGAEDPRDRRLRHEPRRRPRQLRRRQPALHRAERRARLGVRERQHAPVLRRGLEDARLRGRRAARLGDPRPLRRADRLGLAVHEDRPRLRGVASSSGCSTASCRR